MAKFQVFQDQEAQEELGPAPQDTTPVDTGLDPAPKAITAACSAEDKPVLTGLSASNSQQTAKPKSNLPLQKHAQKCATLQKSTTLAQITSNTLPAHKQDLVPRRRSTRKTPARPLKENWDDEKQCYSTSKRPRSSKSARVPLSDITHAYTQQHKQVKVLRMVWS